MADGPANDNFTIWRGTAPTLVFTLTTVPDGGVAGWTTSFTMRLKDTSADPVYFQKAGSISDAALGVFHVALTKAETLALAVRGYQFSFERTDAGFEDLLSIGHVTVRYDVKNAPAA